MPAFHNAQTEATDWSTTLMALYVGGCTPACQRSCPPATAVNRDCLASAMVLCIVAGVRVFLSLTRVWGPRGPFNWLGYMDATVVCIDLDTDLLVFEDNLQRVAVQTILFSSVPEQLLVIATYKNFHLTFHPRAVYIGESRMPLLQGLGCIRVASRHLFRHVHDKVDKMKLFSAKQRASTALAMVRQLATAASKCATASYFLRTNHVRCGADGG